jgi:hypothetical protein
MPANPLSDHLALLKLEQQRIAALIAACEAGIVAAEAQSSVAARLAKAEKEAKDAEAHTAEAKALMAKDLEELRANVIKTIEQSNAEIKSRYAKAVEVEEARLAKLKSECAEADHAKCRHETDGRKAMEMAKQLQSAAEQAHKTLLEREAKIAELKAFIAKA